MKASNYQRMQAEQQRLAKRAEELDAELAHSRNRVQELRDAELAHAQNQLQQIEEKLAGTRRGHEHALCELEDARAELSELSDENRRLKIRVTEVPEISYQVLMRQQHEEAQFRDADPAFIVLYERVKSFSMTSIERLYAMYKAAEYVSRARISRCYRGMRSLARWQYDDGCFDAARAFRHKSPVDFV